MARFLWDRAIPVYGATERNGYSSVIQDMPYVQSASIESITYDETRKILTARFRADGRVASYGNVPPEIYDALIFADSISAYFQKHIEGLFPVHRDPPARVP